MSELTQLDQLIESDILEALGEESSQTIQEPQPIEEEILIEDLEANEEQDEVKEDIEVPKIEKVLHSDDLATLLSQLLKNKTLEITIKIKD